MISYKPLWKTLIDRNMRQTELREKANFSKPTLAKMNQNEYISLEIIDKICKTLNCKIEDVIEYKEG